MSTRPQTTFAALALTLFFGTLAVAGGPAGTVSTRRMDARRRCAILAEPVRGIRPAQLTVPGSLESRTARRTPMLFAGYGFTELGPDGDVPPPSEWDGWRRIKAERKQG